MIAEIKRLRGQVEATRKESLRVVVAGTDAATVERAARAIIEADGYHWGFAGPETKERGRKLARAVLAATAPEGGE